MFNYLLLAGIVIGLGFLIGKGTHYLKVTGVVGYILTGIILGPEILNIARLSSAEIELITNIALGFVAFVIGGQLTYSLFKRIGKKIGPIVVGESLGAFLLVFLGVYLLTRDLSIAIIFGAMAPASAPAGTVAVIHEYKSKGKLTDALLAVVGFDDGFAIIIYAFAIAIVGILLSSASFSFYNVIMIPLREIGGALLIGGVVGGIFAFILRRLHEREEIIALALTAIFITGGFALYLEVSLILSCLVLGMIIINLFPQGNRPVFDHIESISLPVYILFFVIAGLKLRIDLLYAVGGIGIVYIAGRIIGKMSGSYLTAVASKADDVIRSNLGFGILSQAGVAIGLALLASHKLASFGMPESGTILVTTIAATTVVFEIIGPISARFAIMRAGEAQTK